MRNKTLITLIAGLTAFSSALADGVDFTPERVQALHLKSSLQITLAAGSTPARRRRDNAVFLAELKRLVSTHGNYRLRWASGTNDLRKEIVGASGKAYANLGTVRLNVYRTVKPHSPEGLTLYRDENIQGEVVVHLFGGHYQNTSGSIRQGAVGTLTADPDSPTESTRILWFEGLAPDAVGRFLTMIRRGQIYLFAPTEQAFVPADDAVAAGFGEGGLLAADGGIYGMVY